MIILLRQIPCLWLRKTVYTEHLARRYRDVKFQNLCLVLVIHACNKPKHAIEHTCIGREIFFLQ